MTRTLLTGIAVALASSVAIRAAAGDTAWLFILGIGGTVYANTLLMDAMRGQS